jgi:peroxiredoxin
MPHLRAGILSAAPRRAVSASAPAAATIAVGDKLPDATLSYFDSPDGELKTVTVRDLTAGKKVVLFAVPGAFTPTCTQKHVPGFVAKAGELRAKGVDAVACVSVNDAFVMRAWKESLGVGDEVLLLSDGNGELARAMGVELDLSDKPAGLGVRSRRYALLAEDGVVKVLNLEEGGAFTTSSAEEMLKAL